MIYEGSNLTNSINKAITNLHDDGTINLLKKKWFKGYDEKLCDKVQGFMLFTGSSNEKRYIINYSEASTDWPGLE